MKTRISLSFEVKGEEPRPLKITRESQAHSSADPILYRVFYPNNTSKPQTVGSTFFHDAKCVFEFFHCD